MPFLSWTVCCCRSFQKSSPRAPCVQKPRHAPSANFLDPSLLMQLCLLYAGTSLSWGAPRRTEKGGPWAYNVPTILVTLT